MQFASPQAQKEVTPTPRRLTSRHSRSNSFSYASDDGSQSHHGDDRLPPPVLIYHESARSIVFRDHLRRAVRRTESECETEPFSQSDSSVGSKSTTDNGTSFIEAVRIRPRSVSLGSVSDSVPPPTIRRKTTAAAYGGEHRDPLVGMITPIAEMASEILDYDDTVMPSEAGIPPTQIAGFRPRLDPLPPMEFGPCDMFVPLLGSPNVERDDPFPTDWTEAEKGVVQALQTQRACVKTVKNVDWTAFLRRFCFSVESHSRHPSSHKDVPPAQSSLNFNSFVTSTTMLPESGEKMRCFGSPSMYTVGVVFELPTAFPPGTTEDESAEETETWSWPAGYSAKTEFNIDSRGRLTNGRKEAIRPLSVLRQYNDDYLNQESYMISTRMVSGLSQIPYNEVFLRVGGLGRIVQGKDCATGEECNDAEGIGRSLFNGVGLPSALFVRTASYGHLITMQRTRARLIHIFGESHIRGIPLLLITPENGVRVLTEDLQRELWKIASRNLNPFQNPAVSYKTTVTNTDDECFEQKVEELLDLDDNIREMLTPEELARLAGGFGATDESVALILKSVMMTDKKANKDKQESSEASHKLQDVVNEGLASALRSGDYHTSRQLLILYSLVASRTDEEAEEDAEEDAGEHKIEEGKSQGHRRQSSLGRDAEVMKKDLELARKANSDGTLAALTAPPPPPPLDTDRLRMATNSDGLLAVLGAAQVLKAMQDGSAKKRTEEVVAAVEEWVNHGEQSMAFRISSWYDQRAAQDDLRIATENNSSFMAFLSNKAISNRRNFASQLLDATESTDFTTIRFLQAISEIVGRMHSPCLRLELLQYVLGLDNRYSVAHLARSVELAAICLGISSTPR